MKNKRFMGCDRLVRSALVILLSLVCIISGVTTISAAKNEDVTKKIGVKERTKLKELAANFENSCGYAIAYDVTVGKTKSLDCSRGVGRRYILNYSMPPEWMSMDDLSLNMFGSKTINVEHVNGDWGLSAPQLKVVKIYKLSTTDYRVDCKMNWTSSYVNKVDRVGTVRLYVTRKKEAYYGYWVKKVWIKKLAEIPDYEEAEDVTSDSQDTQTEQSEVMTPEKLEALYQPYKAIVNKYQSAVKSKWDADKLESKYMSNLIMNAYGKDASKEGIGFVPYDLDGDGIYELLITSMTGYEKDGDKMIYAAYKVSLVDGVGKATRLFISGERDRYFLLKKNEQSDGNLLREMSESVSDSQVYELEYKGGDISVVRGIIYSAPINEDSSVDEISNPWYETTSYELANRKSVRESYATEQMNRLEERKDFPGCLGISQGFFIPDPEVKE